MAVSCPSRAARTCEPRPLAQVRQIRPAAPAGAVNLGPGRQIVSQDSPDGVSRIGGQAGTQAPDHTPVSSQNRGSRAGSTNPQSPCRIWVTEGAVEKHISSILIKLNLHEADDDHRRVLAVITFGLLSLKARMTPGPRSAAVP